MGWRDYLVWTKFVSLFGLPIVYIVCFASKTWVTTPVKNYGLWQWCYSDYSDNVKNANYVNDSMCHTISPGDSPGYYEAVRTMATFTLVFHLLYVFTCNPNEGLGQEKKPCLVAFVAMVGATITVSILGSCYSQDERWKDHDPSLGWCFWLVVTCAIVDGFTIWVCWMYHEMSKKPTTYRAVAPATTTNRQQNNNTSTVTTAGNRKTTISRTPGADNSGGGASSSTSGGNCPSCSGAASSSRSSDNHPHSNVPTVPHSAATSAGPPARPGTRESSGNQFPVLTLPHYYIPPESWESMPVSPPPSYEEVIRGGTLSPPLPYLPPEDEK